MPMNMMRTEISLHRYHRWEIPCGTAMTSWTDWRKHWIRQEENESYTYDSVGNLTKKTVNDTRVTSYVYDANGNLTSLTNVLGANRDEKCMIT